MFPRATELRVSCGASSAPATKAPPHGRPRCYCRCPRQHDVFRKHQLQAAGQTLPSSSPSSSPSEFRVYSSLYTNSKHPHPHPHSPRLRIQAPAVLKRATGCVPDSPGFALDRLPYGDLEAPKTRRPGSTQARMKRWQEGSLSKAPGRTRRLGVPWHRRLC
jgi:hypothetical protein